MYFPRFQLDEELCDALQGSKLFDDAPNGLFLAEAISRAMAQKAKESLRNGQTSMVWKSAHGEYAVDDVAMHRWYAQRLASNCWPPTGSQLDLLEE
jgi:hypothetical protein